jgi:hypothetical protein
VVGNVVVSKSRGRLVTLTVHFNEPLDPDSASNFGLYHVYSAVKRHRKTVYSKPVSIRNVIYNASTISVMVNLARATSGSVELTIAAGIVGANGGPGSSAFTTIVK